MTESPLLYNLYLITVTVASLLLSNEILINTVTLHSVNHVISAVFSLYECDECFELVAIIQLRSIIIIIQKYSLLAFSWKRIAAAGNKIKIQQVTDYWNTLSINGGSLLLSIWYRIVVVAAGLGPSLSVSSVPPCVVVRYYRRRLHSGWLGTWCKEDCANWVSYYYHRHSLPVSLLRLARQCGVCVWHSISTVSEASNRLSAPHSLIWLSGANKSGPLSTHSSYSPAPPILRLNLLWLFLFVD